MSLYVNGILQPVDLLKRSVKLMTFAEATGTGSVGAVPLFTVTGEVMVSSIMSYCTVDLTENVGPGGATLALGVTGGTSDFVAATTALDINAGTFWVDTAPDANGVALPAACKDILITDNIIGTVATSALTGGAIRFTVVWVGLSADANVVAV